MNEQSILRGMATVSFWADDVKEAAAWYTKLLGVEPYFVRPTAEAPEYAEFRIGDYQHELGIISRNYLPKGTSKQPSGAVLFWHVDDIDAALATIKSMGATEHEPRIERGAGFITASVVDPFDNIVGLMHNPHYLEIVHKKQGA